MPTALAPHRFEVPRYSNHDFDQIAQRTREIAAAGVPWKDADARAEAEYSLFRTTSLLRGRRAAGLPLPTYSVDGDAPADLLDLIAANPDDVFLAVELARLPVGGSVALGGQGCVDVRRVS